MKDQIYKISIAFVLLMFGFSGYSQTEFEEDNSWINRTHMLATQDCVDSVTCYTQVVIDVNPSILYDSVSIILSIGSTVGSQDIYGARYVYTPSISAKPGISIDSVGVLKFDLGKYLVTDDFYVDMYLE